jgi:hypothetical protein
MQTIFTRIQLGPFGYTGAICAQVVSFNGSLVQGRYVIPWGSRKTVRLALKRELTRIRKACCEPRTN